MTEEIFDIAISFLSDDEGLAGELYAALSETLSVFVYSKKQEEVAGGDGVEAFRDIFLSRSKLRVVLHRAGWGNTRWTSVEEQAIRDYGFKNQWRDIVLVKLDSASPPEWFPESSIYLDFEKYGLEQLVGVIKAQAQQAGALFRPDDALEHAKRVAASARFEEERRTLIDSYEGVKAVEAEVQQLFQCIGKLCESISRDHPELKILFGANREECIMTVRGREAKTLSVYWQPDAANTLRESYLIVCEFDGTIKLPEETGYISKKPQKIREQEIAPDYNRNGHWVWRVSQKPILTSALADRLVKDFLSLLEK